MARVDLANITMVPSLFESNGHNKRSDCRYTKTMMQLRLVNVLSLLVLTLLVFGGKASPAQDGFLRGGETTMSKREGVNNGDAEVTIEEQRRLFSFWSLLFFVGPCHGPLAHPSGCASQDGGSGSGSGGNDGGSDGSGGNDNQGAAATNNDDGSSGASGSTSGVSRIGNTNLTKTSLMLIIVAACAAIAAAIAMVVGNRRNKEELHPLSGSLDRRMNLFSALADGNLCGDRPPRTFEMA